MARNSSFSTDDFLHSAASLIAEGGMETATMAAILRHAGASAGSFYYRFHSREQLLGELWFSIVERFQEGFLSFLRRGDGLSAALFTPRWTRQHRIEARVLLLHHKSDFVSGQWPEDFVERAKTNADAIRTGVEEFTRTIFGDYTEELLHQTQFALMDVPYAAVRRYLAADEPVPDSVDEMVRTCYEALMPMPMRDSSSGNSQHSEGKEERG
jgi:AcrR family transcriptional regulator